jgi:hypothetical protein
MKGTRRFVILARLFMDGASSPRDITRDVLVIAIKTHKPNCLPASSGARGGSSRAQ